MDLIVFEGPDWVGKGTQAKLLLKYCDRLRVSAILEHPLDRTELGRSIRALAKSDTAMSSPAQLALYLAAHIQFFAQLDELPVAPEVLIMDRSVFSTMVYQWEAANTQSGKRMVEGATEWLVKPDAVIILEMDAEKAMQRGTQTDRYETLDFQRDLQQRYREIAKVFPDTAIDFVNADDTPERVHNEILLRLCARLDWVTLSHQKA